MVCTCFSCSVPGAFALMEWLVYVRTDDQLSSVPTNSPWYQGLSVVLAMDGQQFHT